MVESPPSERLVLMFAVFTVDATVEAVCPMVIYFIKQFMHFALDRGILHSVRSTPHPSGGYVYNKRQRGWLRHSGWQPHWVLPNSTSNLLRWYLNPFARVQKRFK
jgi:hypothetical protein